MVDEAGAPGGGYVQWWAARAGLGRGPARGAAGRGGRHFLGGGHLRQRNDHVGAPGADGALAVGLAHQLAERIRQAALNAVSDHHPGAERGIRKELLRRRRRRTHPSILVGAPCDASG